MLSFLPRGGNKATPEKVVLSEPSPILWPVRSHNNSDCNTSYNLVKIRLSHLSKTLSEHSSDFILYFVS